jgi:hypothetical protein
MRIGLGPKNLSPLNKNRHVLRNATLVLGSIRSGKLLVVLTSAVILGSDSFGTDDHILLSHGSGGRASARGVWLR